MSSHQLWKTRQAKKYAALLCSSGSDKQLFYTTTLTQLHQDGKLVLSMVLGASVNSILQVQETVNHQTNDLKYVIILHLEIRFKMYEIKLLIKVEKPLTSAAEHDVTEWRKLQL